jgi:hypothetical protein
MVFHLLAVGECDIGGITSLLRWSAFSSASPSASSMTAMVGSTESTSLMWRRVLVVLDIWGGNLRLTLFRKAAKACSYVIVIGILASSIPIPAFTGTKKSAVTLWSRIQSFISGEWTTRPSLLLYVMNADVICFSNSSHHMWGFFSPP